MDDIELLVKAADFAAHKHRSQCRKDRERTPYINHPLALARVLKVEAGIGEAEVIAAAILHDTVEDTETTIDELEREFGSRVAAIVREVTDDKLLLKAERKRVQEKRVAGSSREAKLVKLADKICNLRDIVSAPPADWPLERRQEYFDWAKRVVSGVKGVHPKLEGLFDDAYARRP